jgi:hypothetical protein
MPWMKVAMFMILLMAHSVVALCQEPKDSTRRDSGSKPLRSLRLEFFQNNFDFIGPSTPELSAETFPSYVRQSFASPLPTLPWQIDEHIGFQSIWKQELARRDEYKTLRTILGTMQAGATAYLLYKHLKKYGLK